MRTDFELQSEVNAEIHKAFEQMPGLAGKGIWVEASDGIVVLNGMVKTRDERQRAEQAAWSAKGVRAVYNDIRVAA